MGLEMSNRTAIKDVTNSGSRRSGPAPAALIRRSTLHDQVATCIRDLIIEGELPPGGRINEAILGERLGVSRTPLREALRTLAGEGLVDFRPSRGTVVHKWTAEDVFSMLEVLSQLERLAGRLACERGSDDELAEVLGVHSEMMEHYARRDRLPYYKCNQAIHTSIATMAHNPTLVETHGRIQARLKRIRFTGNRTPEAWAAAVAEHEEMARALANRDGEALSEVLARHLDNTWERVRDAV